MLGRIRVRLLVVNLVVVLVPLLGIEAARLYERQLLDALERDMLNQATLVRSSLESELDGGAEEPFGERTERWLARAAERTRTRIRVVRPGIGVVLDSHRHGPPEGKEGATPLLVRDRTFSMRDSEMGPISVDAPVPDRREIVTALAGSRATATRTSDNPVAVFLFLAEPVRHAGEVVAAVYVTRSTQPVLLEMHRVRRGLVLVLALALVLTAASSLTLALTISRPLERLARAARRISAGDTGAPVPLGGGGEIGELAHEFASMTARLEQRQRYISELSADVAHEFKSPLTSIRGAAELLQEGAAEDPEARQRFLDNIKLDAERLTRLVTRLLELSRIDASEQLPRTVDLRQLVSHVIARSEGPTARITLSYEATVSLISARASDLEAALFNLLDNALRFSPEGETVEVSVRGPTPDQCVVLEVMDRGPGVSPEHAPRLFERFFTTDAERNGTGLGLAIVKSVALAHRGDVSFRQREHGGASFQLRLRIA